MKHFSRFIISAGILLVSLMIHHGQKCETSKQINDKPDIESVGLQAEICFTNSAGLSLPGFTETRGIPVKHRSVHPDNPVYLLRLKQQMQIHQEIRAELELSTGPGLRQHLPPEDPPIA